MQVALLEDGVLRAALRSLLEATGLEVVGDAADPEEFLRLVSTRRPDVAIVDIRLDPDSEAAAGLDVARRLDRLDPSIGILAFSTFDETAWADQLLAIRGERGIGYLLKDRVDSPQVLLEGLARIHAGGVAIDSGIVARLVDYRHRQGGLQLLTAKEREVLRLMAEGLSNAAIATALTVSGRTVETHIANLLRKLDLDPDRHDRRVAAALTWLRAGPA